MRKVRRGSSSLISCRSTPEGIRRKGSVAGKLANPAAFTHNSLRVDASGGFMFALRSSKFELGLMLATALSVSMWPAAGKAYTPEQEQACTGDAMRLCGAYIPDVDRITVCMIQNKSQLTPGCRAHFRPEPRPKSRSVNAGSLSASSRRRRESRPAPSRRNRGQACEAEGNLNREKVPTCAAVRVRRFPRASLFRNIAARATD